MEKIIRSICIFAKIPKAVENKLAEIERKLIEKNYTIQTKRLCSPSSNFLSLEREFACDYNSIGTVDIDFAEKNFEDFVKSRNTVFNIDLTNDKIDQRHTNILYKIIKRAPEKTFNFTYVFNNAPSSPFFPSANYEKDGFSIGLQPTDLSENCNSLEDWFDNMKTVWNEILEIFKDDVEFLGIDSSIAPLFEGSSSVVNFVKRLGMNFSNSVLSDTYLKMTNFIKANNPKPIGLCGLMLPCLEDFELAEEYEKGEFSIDRNIFLSMHSGLGIDTYPIGINEKAETIIGILKLVQGLSNKYKKPLSARFVSDGKSKIGEKIDLRNQYLKDVVIRKLGK